MIFYVVQRIKFDCWKVPPLDNFTKHPTTPGPNIDSAARASVPRLVAPRSRPERLVEGAAAAERHLATNPQGRLVEQL